MIQSLPVVQLLAECRDKTLVGGKAINLGRLIRAGFPVPDGFVVTTGGFEAWREAGGAEVPKEVAEAVLAAYAQMGRPRVAVRSSATIEDLAEVSMAGQYETFLDVGDGQSLLSAIRRCWESLDSPRTRSYLAEHQVDAEHVAMAVVVQRLVPAEVAGVLFCANPRTGQRNEMLLEASWGLGQAVVSGCVQPDVLRIERESGRLLASDIADKQVMVDPLTSQEVPVPESRRRLPCLNECDIRRLWELGRQAEEHFGTPQDLEWSIHQGQVFLLQSRPITTLQQAETYDLLQQSTIRELEDQLAAGRGPWILHNISETLPHPTPLTWSVIRPFMSGVGGFGRMYRMAGFQPSQAICRDGFLRRIAGKVYMDLSLAGEMFFEGFPYRYDLESLASNPDAAQAPPTIPSGTPMRRYRVGRRIRRINRNLHRLAEHLDADLREKIIPEFEQWCRREKQRDLARLSCAELSELWEQRRRRVMDEFAAQILLPSLISAMALADLRTLLDECFWDEDPDALAAMLSAGHLPDKTIRGNAQLRQVGLGQLPLESWLAEYGHRGPEEFDLATARWRDRREELLALAGRLKDAADPLELHEQSCQATARKLEELRARLPQSQRAELDHRVELVQRYMPFREDGKYYLILGYDLLRDIAEEAGARLGIGSDVYQLSAEELFAALSISSVPRELIEQRKILYEAECRLVLPRIIDGSAIRCLGQAGHYEASSVYPAFAVSTGLATGPVRVVCTLADAGNLARGCILVCPSTDPGWTPLFVNAAGLVLECGGTLSHGAVIAREMNIPAVVLPGATRLFRDGEIMTVDGRQGLVVRAGASPTKAESASSTRIERRLQPPIPGRKERLSGRLRSASLLVWVAYLLAVWLLPADWLYQPTLRVMDWLFWPLVRMAGRPGSVAILSVVMAVLTMMGQRWLTDNARLREAKRRSNLLWAEVRDLPRGCKRRLAAERIGMQVQVRVAMAAMVPLAVLLGPLVMTFVWFGQRMDVRNWNAEPGTVLTVVGTVSGELAEPVLLEVGPGLSADGPVSQRVLPMRQSLERLAQELRRVASPAELPELRAAGFSSSAEALADLQRYLSGPMPPQTLTWRVLSEENRPGRFPIAMILPGQQRLEVWAVLGDAFPPSPVQVRAGPDQPLQSLRIVYGPPTKKRVFYAPLAFLGFSQWDAGWLIVYLATYLPATLATKWLLRVA